MRFMSSRSGKKFVLVAVIITVLMGGMVSGIWLASRFTNSKEGAAGKANAGASSGHSKTAQDHEPASLPDEEAGHQQIVMLGEFTVNVRAVGALRYLQAEVALAMHGLPTPKKGGHGGSSATPALPEGEAAVARDRVVAVLSATDYGQAGTPEGRERLKQQIAAAVDKALPTYHVQEVLFTAFVMQ